MADQGAGGQGAHHGHAHGDHRGHVFDPERFMELEQTRRGWLDPDRFMVQMLVRNDLTLVDVGAGAGFFALAAAKVLTRGRVLAVDRQADMVALLKERASKADLANVHALVGDAAALPVESSAADVALFATVLHDLSDPLQALKEAVRVLKPGGGIRILEFRPGATEQGPPQEILFQPDVVLKLLADAGCVDGILTQGPGPLYQIEARTPSPTD